MTERPVTVIRSFLNADLPRLKHLWVEHWSAMGPSPVVSEPQFEQAVLARTFFRAEQMLVAQRDNVPVAWLHFSEFPDSPVHFAIPAICLGRDAEPGDAGQLIEEAIKRIAASGGQTVEAGVIRDHSFGYAGLDPVGHGVGILDADIRVGQALQAAGFHPDRVALAMTAAVPGFRPPVSREALQLRRSSHVEMVAFNFQDSRTAAAMSHLDVETHRLVDRAGDVLAEIDFWFSDPEAQVMNPSLMIADLGSAQRRGKLEPPEVYLLGTSIQAAARRNILSVQSAVDEDQSELLAGLGSLQFQPTQRGTCWKLELAN